MGGVNLVTGFRPDLWRAVAPDDAPPGPFGVSTRTSSALRATGCRRHSTTPFSGCREARTTSFFETARAAIASITTVATVAEETSSWPYQHDRDLTGFIDGSENPTLIEAPEFAVIGEGPGAGGTILLLQKWSHDSAAWELLFG